MIPCYVIVWHDADMTYRCLKNLSQDKRLELTVIHNMSSNFYDVESEIYRAAGKPRIITTQTNIAADAFLRTMEVFPPHFDQQYVICTDGDIVLEDIMETVTRQVHLLDSHSEVFCVSSRIRMTNLPTKTFPESVSWVPEFPDAGDYLKGPGPHHFVMFRSWQIRELVEWINAHDLNWVDTAIGAYAAARGQHFAILKDHWHRHLGWDAYADLDHPYTKEKLKRSFQETWAPKK